MSCDLKTDSQPRVMVFCMVKDEEDIIHEWINYHGYLFGIDHLHLINNNSQQATLDILEYYRRHHGLNVYHRDDYSKKGDYICELIRANSHLCDIAIPLDIDEFIGVLESSVIPDNIVHRLRGLVVSFVPCRWQ